MGALALLLRPFANLARRLLLASGTVATADAKTVFDEMWTLLRETKARLAVVEARADLAAAELVGMREEYTRCKGDLMQALTRITALEARENGGS